MSDESRVNMVWPADLKEAVRTKVGGRKLTEFTVDAVRAKLGLFDQDRVTEKELNEVKDLAQRLADRIALGGDYEDREEVLRELDLPAWIQTVGWPEPLVRIVKPEDPVPEPVVPKRRGPAKQEGGDDEDLHRPMFMVGAKKQVETPAIGDPESIVKTEKATDLPHDSQGNDLWARIQATAVEKGVDLSGVPMKRASQIERPEPKLEASEPEPEVQTDVPTEISPEEREYRERIGRSYAQEIEEQDAAAAEESASSAESQPKCPKCGSELIAGECWECM